LNVSAVDVRTYRFPMDSPYGGADAVSAAVVLVHTNDGLEGLGHIIPLYDRQFRSLTAAIEELCQQLIGQDPTRPEAAWRKLVSGGWGPGGVGNMAAAALDIAVWDLAGKAAGQPLYRLLGGANDRIPVYASLRLGRSEPAARLPDIAHALVDQGFQAMKMNLAGQGTLAADVERVRLVRDAIGPDVKLLADVNSNWTASDSIRAGHAIAEYNLHWLEDPAPIYDLPGLAEVRSALDTQIATGESLYSVQAFRPLFEARAVDVPMPDLARVGGVTPFLKIAHLAEAFGLPIANHLAPEISAQIVAAVPNGRIVEFVPWAWKLLRGCPSLEEGQLVMSERPGHGMELDADFAERHRLG
jgi:L-talarate/galactarate dehydratase